MRRTTCNSLRKVAEEGRNTPHQTFAVKNITIAFIDLHMFQLVFYIVLQQMHIRLIMFMQ